MPVTRLFNDDYNRANNTNLGVNYEERQGDAEIAGNQLRKVGAAGLTVVLWKGSAPSDHRVEFKDKTVLGTLGGPACRIGSGATPDLYFMNMSPAGTARLFKRVSGTVTQLGSNVAVSRVADAVMRVQAQLTRIRTYYNAAIIHNEVDSAVTSGAAGVLFDVGSAQELDDLEVYGEFFWNFVANDIDFIPEMRTEVEEYESGFEQFNQIWVRQRRTIRLRYDALTNSEVDQMDEFLQRRRGRTEAFLIQNPRKPNPSGIYFALGDGTTTKFKIREDWAELITTYTNGVVDSPQPTFDYFTGLVTYASAPAKGTVLTYDATNARYRVHFTEDRIRFTNTTWERWGADIEFRQEKTMIEGVPQ